MKYSIFSQIRPDEVMGIVDAQTCVQALGIAKHGGTLLPMVRPATEDDFRQVDPNKARRASRVERFRKRYA